MSAAGDRPPDGPTGIEVTAGRVEAARRERRNFATMEITLVKAAKPGGRDRAYLEVDGLTRRGPIHVVHDLPHLVVESLFGVDDGLGGEVAAGAHPAAAHAATARNPNRQKQGRIVSGAAAGAATGQWLTPGHRLAKTITDCVDNRLGDGPEPPAGVRDRVAR